MDEANHLKLILAGGKMGCVYKMLFLDEGATSPRTKCWGEVKALIMLMPFFVKTIPTKEVKKNNKVYKDLIVPMFKRWDKTQFLNIKGIKLQVRVPTTSVHWVCPGPLLCRVVTVCPWQRHP